jgi:hypothetical protein
MNEKTKIIILRVLLSIGMIALVSIIVIPIMLSLLPPIDQKYYEIISYSIMATFFTSGCIFIILELIWKVDLDKKIFKKK